MDFDNWDNKYGLRWHYVIIAVVIIAIVIWVYIEQHKERNGPPPGSDFEKEGNGKIYYKGRGSDEDSVATL